MALPKISGVQTVAPRGSIPISVSKTSPVNEVIAASAGNLSKRLDSFAASANKIAIGQGKMTGERQGAIDAAELLEQARQTGEPISLSDLPGDFSSISVVEQVEPYRGPDSPVADRGGEAGSVVIHRRQLDGRESGQIIRDGAKEPSQDQRHRQRVHVSR